MKGLSVSENMRDVRVQDKLELTHKEDCVKERRLV